MTPTCLLLALALQAAPADSPGDVLTSMPPAAAAEALAGQDGDDAALARGVAQTLAAVEALGRGLYELGPRGDSPATFLTGAALPIPPQQDPPAVNAEMLGKVMQTFADDLAAARRTLEQIDTAGDVALPLDVAAVRLDLDGDGQSGEGETMGALLGNFGLTPRPEPRLRVRDNRGRLVNPPGGGAGDGLVIDFDAADVHWLIGYTHLLEGVTQALLAHDPTELLERAGTVAFLKIDTPHEFLNSRPAAPGMGGFAGGDPTELFDVVAFLHLLRLEPTRPERLEQTRQHFLAAIDRSGRMLDAAQAETDDANEWVPAPDQTAALPGARVDVETVRAWRAVLEDGRAALEGERLVPFWRGTDPAAGVNLKRVFTEPTTLDVVLWVQGTAATPYLERDKPLISADSFRQLAEATNGRPFLFAAWFN